jgi:hypothetical protein
MKAMWKQRPPQTAAHVHACHLAFT